MLATWIAVVAGMAYNYLPFTALPLYVALERIDRRVVEAAGDLYSNRTSVFMSVDLPARDPGHLRRVPADVRAGRGRLRERVDPGRHEQHDDRATSSRTRSWIELDYPAASALSAILMAAMLIGIFLYSKVLGSRTIEEYV